MLAGLSTVSIQDILGEALPRIRELDMNSNVFKEAVAKAAADDAAMSAAQAEEGLSREPTTRKAQVL